jgi:hypothetical protein
MNAIKTQSNSNRSTKNKVQRCLSDLESLGVLVEGRAFNLKVGTFYAYYVEATIPLKLITKNQDYQFRENDNVELRAKKIHESKYSMGVTENIDRIITTFSNQRSSLDLLAGFGRTRQAQLAKQESIQGLVLLNPNDKLSKLISIKSNLKHPEVRQLSKSEKNSHVKITMEALGTNNVDKLYAELGPEISLLCIRRAVTEILKLKAQQESGELSRLEEFVNFESAQRELTHHFELLSGKKFRTHKDISIWFDRKYASQNCHLSFTKLNDDQTDTVFAKLHLDPSYKNISILYVLPTSKRTGGSKTHTIKVAEMAKKQFPDRFDYLIVRPFSFSIEDFQDCLFSQLDNPVSCGILTV